MKLIDVLADPAFASRLCWTLLHSLWQVGGLAALAWTLERFLACRSAAVRYNLHVVALLSSIAAVPATYLWLTPQARVAIASRHTHSKMGGMQAAAANRQPAPAVEVPRDTIRQPAPMSSSATFDWAPLATRSILAFYSLGACAMLARLVAGMWRGQRLVTGSQLIAGGPQWQALADLARDWQMRRLPRLAVARDLAMPCVTGLLRPTIVLPIAAVCGMSAAELELILAHELAHVRRGDLWIHLLARLAEALLFFNPGVWYLSRRLATLREYCCDELACRLQGESQLSRIAYARALVRSAELSLEIDPQGAAWTEIAMLASGGRSASELRRRVSRLLDEPLAEPVGVSRPAVLALAAALVIACVLPTVAFSESKPENSAKVDKPKAGGSISLPLEPQVMAIRVDGRGPWWDAKGKVLARAPEGRASSRAGFRAGQHLEELFFKVPGLPADASLRHEVTAGGWTSRDRVTGSEGQPLSDVLHVRFAISPEQKTFDLRVGIAAGPWKTVYSGDPSAQAQGTNDRKGIVLSDVFASDGKSVVIVSHNWLDGDTRLIAVDKAGKTHRPSSFQQLGAADNVVNQSTYEFSKLPAEQIEKFEFQLREFKWTELKNLPARPRAATSGGDKRVTLSGRIVAGEGMSPETRGYLGADGSSGTSFKRFESANSTENQFTITAQPGSIWLKYFPEESAPTWIGPFEAEPGQVIDGLELKLSPGYRASVRVSDEEGKPIAGAAVLVTPVNGVAFSSNTRTMHTGQDGTFELEHLAKTAYNFRVNAGGFQTLSMDGREIRPDETVVFTLSRNLSGAERTIKVSSPAPPRKFTLSGKIYDADGKLATTSGQLDYELTQPSGNRSIGSWTRCTDAFSIELPESVAWLKYFPKGFAPTAIGPFDVNDGTKLDDLRIDLQPGIAATARIADAAGRPIAGAKLIALPEMAGSTNGPWEPLVADAEGIVPLEHLADAPYSLKATASGFEPLVIPRRRIAAGETVSLEMQASLPAVGHLKNADGSPAAGAKLLLRLEAEPGAVDFANDRLLTTTDEAGRFTLDELRNNFWYLVRVEAADGVQALLPPVQVGQTIDFTLPTRHALKLRVRGDISKLNKRGDRPFINLSQSLHFQPVDGVGATDRIWDYVLLTPSTTGGGWAEYSVLLPEEPLTIQSGNLSEQIPAGTKEFVLQLPE